jgi:hypothetical protein
VNQAVHRALPVPSRVNQMYSAVKTILLWLLIAAMPLQGLASVMTASCGPNHYGAVTAAVATHDDHHAANAVHSHRQGDATGYFATDSVLPDAVQAAVQPVTAHDSHASSYCSACAACCAGAGAPPPVSNWAIVHNDSVAVFISPARLVTGYIPSGLERPPRYTSA